MRYSHQRCQYGPIWPTAAEIVRMGLCERGALLEVLEARNRDLLWQLNASESFEFLGADGVDDLGHESILIDGLIEIINGLGYLTQADVESV